MHFGIDTAKVKGAVAEKDDVGGRGRYPVVIGVREEGFYCFRMHTAVAEGVVNCIGGDDFCAVTAAFGLRAPVC